MLQLIQEAWKKGVRWKSSLTVSAKSDITIRTQKWLGPGEMLRIVDLDIDGSHRRLALWQTKNSAQMIELALEEPQADARGAAC